MGANNLKKSINNKFTERFGPNPLMISSPGRINIIGEHTDYNNGYVFPAAIDKYIILGIATSDQDHCTVVASDLDESFDFSLNNFSPQPVGSWKNYVLGVADEILKLGYELHPFNMVFGGDIPGGAGLSSSAALENAVVFGLNELFGLGLSKNEMIFISQRAEHNYVGVKCGIMDQYASLFGKANHALHLDCRSLKADMFELDLQDYEIVLINTNVKHSLSDSAYNNRRSICEKTAALLDKDSLREVSLDELNTIKEEMSYEDFQKALYVIEEIERTQKATKALLNKDLVSLGQLIYQSHNGLQKMYEVSCEELDFLVDLAKSNSDVLGARMMGGGFGGCTINLIHKSATDDFIAGVKKKYYSEFNKNCTVYHVKLSDGTSIIQ